MSLDAYDVCVLETHHCAHQTVASDLGRPPLKLPTPLRTRLGKNAQYEMQLQRQKGKERISLTLKFELCYLATLLPCFVHKQMKIDVCLTLYQNKVSHTLERNCQKDSVTNILLGHQ